MPSSDPSLHTLFSLEGQVALVTGGGNGIGHGIADLFARAGGARVAINDLADVPGHHELADELEAADFKALAVDGSVTDSGDVGRIVAAVEEVLGPIDILVTNAGIGMPLTIDQTSYDDWQKTLAVHLGGAFLMAQAVLPGMISRRRGVIIQMSSIVAHQGAVHGHVAYATAKAGLLGFTKTLSRTAAPHGVRVNAIAPGMVETQMLRDTHGSDGIARLLKDVPLGRLASVRDIAAAALFLASPAAAHITGATLDVNGGHYLR